MAMSMRLQYHATKDLGFGKVDTFILVVAISTRTIL
jgi:hypothetical protein